MTAVKLERGLLSVASMLLAMPASPAQTADYGPQPAAVQQATTAGPMPYVPPVSSLPQLNPVNQPGAGPVQSPAVPPAYQPVPPANKVAQSNPWNLLNNARAMIYQGQPQNALQLISEFIKLKPLEPEGYFWRGVALDNMQQTEQALSAYAAGVQQVLKAGMDSAELRMNAGNDLLKLGRLEQAIEQYRRAAQIDPGLPLVHLNLGRALIEKGDYNSALECFQRCEDLHYKPYQLSYYRAKALKKAGRIDDARAQVLMALSKLTDGSPASLKLKQEFSDLLSSR